MKKSLFLIPALALSLASCSNDETVNAPESGSEGNYETNYLSINLVQAPDAPTRADETYEDGDKSENKVKNVRFYFFDADGNAAGVKKISADSYQNYYDWTSPESANAKENPNIEDKLKAVLIINTKAGDKLPAKIVAILNPDKLSLGTANLSLTQLQNADKAKDFASYVNVASDPVFVMANSVYGNSGNTDAIVATEISTANYATSSDAATKNPIYIYVERNVAKVRVTLHSNLTTTVGNDTYIKLQYLDENQEKKDLLVGDQQVYLKLDKWNVTAAIESGNLLKNIDVTTWAASGSGVFSTWNKPEYFRSFWAKNVENATQKWPSYNEIVSNNGKGYYTTPEDKLVNSLYVNENAPNEVYSVANTGDFTKVIMAGELGTISGTTFTKATIAKYAGTTTIISSIDDFKTLLLNSMGSAKIYKDNEQKQPLTTSDVEFKTAWGSQVNGVTQSESSNGRYYVYLQLKATEGSSQTYYKADGTAYTDAAAVNADLIANPGRAQIYNEGKTYYYFPIEHLGETTEIGGYGVVRNHIYDCKITNLTSLGTPVYDPTEPIYPEKSEDDDTFIAAQINILSWRLVSHEISLAW